MQPSNDNGKKWWWVGVLLSVVVVVSSGIGGYAVLRADVARHNKCIEELTSRQDADHDAITEMRSDLKYIRQAVDDLRRERR